MHSSLIRLILVDDHAIVLHGLQRLFAQERGFDVVACCRDGAEALSELRKKGADVMVLDLRMPGLNGLDVIRAIASEGHPCRVVLLTAVVSDTEVRDALDLGTRGLVLKESTPEVLVDCVRRVHVGERWIDQPTMARAVRRESATREVTRTLTARELDVALLVSQGHRNKVIAGSLGISEGTVKIHLHNIYEKLGIDGRIELVLWVREQGLG